MAKSGDLIVADFSKEEGGGRRPRVPEGDYRVKVKEVKSDTSKEGNRMYVWTFVGLDGKLKGKEIRDYTTVTPKSLWKLRSVLEAIGIDVPKSAVRLKSRDVVGKELGITVNDDEYNGRVSSKIADYIDLETLASGGVDDEDEDDEDVEDEDDEESVDLDELDRSELKAYIKENDLDVKVKKSMSDDDIRSAIKEAEGDEDEDDDEIESLDLDDEL